MKATAAIVTKTNGPFELTDVDLAEPQPGEVLVKILAAGICHTDLVVRDGLLPPAPPVVLGHEGAGVVVQVTPSVSTVAPGDRVILTYATCGACRNCRHGRPYHCGGLMDRNFGGGRPDGSATMHMSGEPVNAAFFAQSSFATYALATERNLVKVPADAPLEVLAPLGCGFQTGAGAVLNTLRPEPGSSLAIFGAGAVGLSALLAAAVVGSTLTVVVEPHPQRRSLALELGASHVIDPVSDDPVAAIRELTGGTGVDQSLECTGIPTVLRQAVECLTIPGTCGLVGVPPVGSSTELDGFGLLLGRIVRGVVIGDAVADSFVPAVVDLWRSGRFPLERLIRQYEFAGINDAVADVENGKTVKAVLRMPE